MGTSATEPAPGEPTPGAPTKDERFTAQLAWVLNVFVPVLAPLLLWRLQARGSRFVAHHAKTSSNHALTVMVWMLLVCVVVGGALWAVLAWLEPAGTDEGLLLFIVAVSAVAGLWGLILLALGLVSLVLHLIAMMRAGAGEWYEPPLCWRFMK